SSQDEITINTLPSDVIRNILRLGVESIDEMRLNTLAMEHLANRKLLPTISSFYWFFGENGEMQMKVRIPENLKKYFGVRGTTEEDEYVSVFSFESYFRLDVHVRLFDVITWSFGTS
ncbi:hypothetical protein PMAYCL1PPCAC_19266, partial [Pristionchus mayeri]